MLKKRIIPTLLFKNENDKNIAKDILAKQSQEIFLNTKRRIYLENNILIKLPNKNYKHYGNTYGTCQHKSN